jgi:hypothetical protein
MDRREGVGREQLVHKLVTLVQTVCTLFILALLASSANATELIFEQVRYDGVVYSAFDEGVVPQDYGDRVTGFSQKVPGGIFTYGNLGEGFTPNVTVSYGPYPESASVWWDGFGDLSHVIFTNVRSAFDVTLVADPGFLVNLHGFDLAGWPFWDYTIGTIEILDGELNVLFKQNGAYVEGDSTGPRHSHFEFDDIQASTLILHFDVTNLFSYYWNIGLDNVRFSQLEAGASSFFASINESANESTPVPEPNSALLTVAAFVVIGRRLRSSK